MLISKYGYCYLKDGSKKEVLVEKLRNSNYKILVSCDECNVEFETLFSNRQARTKKGKLDYCQSCSKTGDRNSQFGKDKKQYCKHARSFVTNYGRVFTDETKKQMSETRSKKISNCEIIMSQSNRGTKGWYYSNKNNENFYYDSLLEKLRMEQLYADISISKWTKRHGLKIPYEFNGTHRNTVPDFLITLVDNTLMIEELKGWVQEIDVVKWESIKQYCITNDILYKFTTQKDLNINGEYRRYIKQQKNTSNNNGQN